MHAPLNLPENPRENANHLSRFFCWYDGTSKMHLKKRHMESLKRWLLPLFNLGNQRTIQINDLYRLLNEDESGKLGNQLTTEWLQELDEAKDGKEPSLLRALFKIHGLKFMSLGLYVCLEECFASIGQTICLIQLIGFFSPGSPMQPWEAHLYTLGIIGTSVVRIAAHHGYFSGVEYIGMKCRVACCSLLYRKCLRLGNSTTNTTGPMVNLLSNDISRFDYCLSLLHYIWVAPLHCLLTFAILWVYFGPACLVSMSFFLFFTPFQGWLLKVFGNLRKRAADKTDERIQFLSEIIPRIAVIKMYVWEKPFCTLINKLRRSEVYIIRKTAYFKAIKLSLYYVSSRLLLLSTLLVYTGLGHHLTAEKVFLALSMYDCIRNSMTMYLPRAIAQAGETYVSIKRLQGFLLLEEKLLEKRDRRPLQSGLTLKNFTATWSSTQQKLAVNNITFQLEQGQLLAVIGSVGSGKSALLHAIMGELTHFFGTSTVVGTIAYASQEPWIIPGTIRENILCGQPFDSVRYWKVVESCALLRDFERLPSSDETLVGEAGGTLSGGQKARISMARALYVDADIYLLDDPLSAVDANVRRHLFDKAIASFLQNKTRILVTHSLQHLGQADWVLIMNDGRIEAQGKPADLKDTSVSFANHFGISHMEAGSETLETRKGFMGKNHELEFEYRTTHTEQQIGACSQPEEVVTNSSVSWRVYKKYFLAGGGYLCTSFFLILTVASQTLFTGSDFWLTVWIQSEEELTSCGPYNFTSDFNNSNSLQETCCISSDREFYANVYSAMALSLCLLTTARTILFFYMTSRSSLSLHDSITRCVLQAPISFFNKNPVGRILNRFSKDTGVMDDLLPETFFDCLIIFVNLFGGILAAIVVNPWLIIPPVVFTCFFSVLWRYCVKTARNIKRLEATTRSPVFSHLSSSLSGLATIRAHQVEAFFQRKFDDYQDVNTCALYLSIVIRRWFAVILDGVGALYTASVTIACVVLQGTMNNSSMAGLALSTTVQVISSFQWGVRQSSEAENHMTSVERILEYASLPTEVQQGPHSDGLPSGPWPVNGEIKLENMSVSYSNNTRAALKNITCIIYPGEKVGVIGRTGAGKTSLVSALFRLTEPEGLVEIDGVNIQTVSLHRLRSCMSIVPQEPVLFRGTLRQNLDPLNQHSDQQLWDALQKVNLRETVSNLARGVDTMMYEEGSNFSTGQRQLLCLARAILKQNRIVVLDEATANVDPSTDALIQQVVRKQFAHCTVLTITHRLTTVMNFDRVMVLDSGYLKEFEKPSQLLKDPSSIFSSLVRQSEMQTTK